jgi:hypothetical protein
MEDECAGGVVKVVWFPAPLHVERERERKKGEREIDKVKGIHSIYLFICELVRLVWSC